jgi:hypothetical protein
VAAAVAVIHRAPHTVRPALESIVFHAFHSGLEIACLAGAGVALLGAAAAFRLLPGRAHEAVAAVEPAEPAEPAEPCTSVQGCDRLLASV